MPNTAFLHIMFVHFPVLGTPLLLFLGWKAVRSKSIRNYKTFYWLTLITSLLTVAVYFTGPQTAEWIKTNLLEYPKELVETHALWGRFAFIGSVFSGILGLMAIMNYAQDEKPHKSIPWILIIVLVLNVFVLMYTAHLGGMIRRPDLL